MIRGKNREHGITTTVIALCLSVYHNHAWCFNTRLISVATDSSK